ncbi:gamma-glutamyltransferase [Nocardioides sp. ChNu-99]|uniref:gamma-glutamyltransferase family protein n=1 Tax=unclassified Nocardioides TaxID=2615069 RepID=UPI003217E038
MSSPLPASAFTSPPAHLTRPTLEGAYGMSASTHWSATAAAQSVLERGGNAFDAAVAAAFVLHAVEPHLNGPGGDMVALVAPAGRAPTVVDGQGPAPAGATIERMRAEGLEEVPGSGALAAAVPGAVLALLHVLRDHGTWDVADVLAYAVDQLETGHAAGPQLCGVVAAMADHFIEHWPTSAAIWLREGRAPAVGQVVTNPAYAATLRRLLRAAPDAATREERIDAVAGEWRTGFVAAAVAAAVQRPHRHSSGRDHRGLLTAEDLADARVATEEPLVLDFRGTRVHKAGFWTQGPVLLQALAILDHFPDDHLDPSTALGIHTVAEALKLAMADRDTYYGDAGPVHPEGAGGSSDPRRALLSREYAAARAAQIGATASCEHRPGDLPGLTPWRVPLVLEGGAAAGAGTGEPTVARDGSTRGDTCHVDVVDRHGNLASLTPSGGWLQSSPAVPELGFCLGTRLQMTWLDPDSPSALRPGRRPRTTLSPTMLSRGGLTTAALGTPGGDQQDQWQLLYLLRTLVGGYTPQQAVDAPAFHTTALVSSFWPRELSAAGLVVEDRVGPEVVAELERRGHDVTVADGWSLGRLSAVVRDPATGRLGAAANARGAQGYAAGR